MQTDYGVIGISVDRRKNEVRESLEGVALSTASISIIASSCEMTGTEDAAAHEGAEY